MGAGYYDHPAECTRECAERAVPSPLERDRPPERPCPHCGAPGGVACVTRTREPRRLSVFGRFHPSRMEAA